MNEDKLYIFVHTPRTAGTTFVRQIEANYPEEERLRLYINELNLDPSESYSYKDYKKLVKKRIKDLNKKDIKFIYGHRVPYGIHEYFDKEPYYFTFLRDPVERSKSAYNFWRYAYELGSRKNKKSKKFKYEFLVDGKLPDFITWLEDKSKSKKTDNMGVTQALFYEKLGYLDKNILKNGDLDKFFNKFDHIGLTESYYKSYIFLSEKVGLKRYVTSMNVSKENYVSNLSNRETKKVKTLLKDDIKVYETYLNKFRAPNVSVTDKLKLYKKISLSLYGQPKKLIKELLLTS